MPGQDNKQGRDNAILKKKKNVMNKHRIKDSTQIIGCAFPFMADADGRK